MDTWHDFKFLLRRQIYFDDTPLLENLVCVRLRYPEIYCFENALT